MLMDIFGGVLSGAAYAGDVGNQDKDYDRPRMSSFFSGHEAGFVHIGIRVS